MTLFGDGEAATRALSLIAALATIPAALWAGRALVGARAGWAAAGVAATAPLLTAYAQETRMYALLALLSTLAAGAFVRAFEHGSRRALVAFAALAVLLLYTHNWGLYVLAGFACALPLAAHVRGARQTARDAATAAAIVALAFAPWIPTLLDQAAHTGAPWSIVPPLGEVVKPLTVPLGEGLGALVALLGAAFGLARIARRERAAPGPRTSAALLATALAAGAAIAWLGAQIEPGWADRYMNAFTGPVVLLVGAGLAAAGRAGLVALGAALLIWATDGAPATKSNVRAVAAATAAHTQPGDIAVVTHPEQIAVMSHYLPTDLHWATPLGPTADPSVFDWRDAERRLANADARRTLDGLLRDTEARHLVLIRPRGNAGPVEAPWRKAVADATRRWIAAADGHPRLTRTTAIPALGEPIENRTDVQVVVYRIRVA
jgi:hypothetical protein